MNILFVTSRSDSVNNPMIWTFVAGTILDTKPHCDWLNLNLWSTSWEVAIQVELAGIIQAHSEKALERSMV